MDLLKDSWRQRRADLQKELDLIEGKPGLTIGEASEHSKDAKGATGQRTAAIRLRIAELDGLIGQERGSPDA